MQKPEDKRVQRLNDIKKGFRQNYSRLPFGDWFRRDKKRPIAEKVPLEKNDVLAMVLAALSLVIPWVLGGAALMAGIIILLGWLFGVAR